MGKIILLNDIYPYRVPEEPQFERDILFSGLKKSEQYWRRTPVPRNWSDLSTNRQSKFIETELERMFITGAWFANNGNLVHLPPDAYFYFNWWQMKDGLYPNFRMSQLKEILFENFAESISNCIGTYSFKKRRDGRTTRRMCRTTWKAIQPKYANGVFGMQSKTGTDARDACWATLIAGYRNLPQWVKPDQSGSTDPKAKLVFAKPAIRISRANLQKALEAQGNDQGLNTTIDWRDTVSDAYDGQEMVEFTGDEAAKWKKASVTTAFTTYVRCFWKDGRKVGHGHWISSPSQSNGVEHERSVQLWNMGDPSKHLIVHADGTFEVLKRSFFILRYFTGALEGYGAACDKYGECDQELASELIEEEIANAEPDQREELRRQMPKTIEEILENLDDLVFASAPEMKDRKIYLQANPFRDPVTKEPNYVYANLTWKDGIKFSEVQIVKSQNQKEFSATGKFCFQHLPPKHMRNNMVERRRLQSTIWLPPPDSENVIGADPYDYRRTESLKTSNGAAIGGCALDFYEHGLKDIVFFAYNFRPKTPSDYFEDMLKACFLLSAYLQVESKNKNIIDYFEDEGCFGILLPKNPKQPNSEHKGNATTSTLIDEMCGLIDEYFAVATNLERYYLDMVLSDILKMDVSNTQKSHLTMAKGQWLLGVMKRRLIARGKRGRQKLSTLGSEINRSIAAVYGLNV